MFLSKFSVLLLLVFLFFAAIQIGSTKKYKCFICDGVRFGGLNCESPKEQVCRPNNTDPPLYLLSFPLSTTVDYFRRQFHPHNVTKYLRYPTLFGCVSFEVKRRLYKYCMYKEIDFCKYFDSPDPCNQCYDSGCNTIYYSHADKSLPLHPIILFVVLILNSIL